jgi:hypothetical protein
MRRGIRCRVIGARKTELRVSGDIAVGKRSAGHSNAPRTNPTEDDHEFVVSQSAIYVRQPGRLVQSWNTDWGEKQGTGAINGRYNQRRRQLNLSYRGQDSFTA